MLNSTKNIENFGIDQPEDESLLSNFPVLANLNLQNTTFSTKKKVNNLRQTI